MAVDIKLQRLVAWLISYPTIQKTNAPSRGIGSGFFDNGRWWVKFGIDIGHPAAWTTVQVLSYALNDPDLTVLQGTVFKPVSPPPYLNGGPADYLSWVIEGDGSSDADLIVELLEAEFGWLPDDGVLVT